jgi:hypothetical protein
MKQTKAHKPKLKKAQNGAKLNLKPTLRSKRNTTKDKHRRGGHLEI